MADKRKFSLEIFQHEVASWAEANFGQALPHQPLLGVGEEAGEIYEASLQLGASIGRLSHAQLKFEQGIRGYDREKFETDAADAIGDLMVFLAHYCARAGLNLEACVRGTWEKVQKRDWKEDPDRGGEPVCGNCNLPRCPACGG